MPSIEEPAPEWANPVQVVGLLLSRFCVARCDHCGSDAGPEQRGVLPLEWADRCFAGVRELGLDLVVISGGEPVALPTALRPVMAAAQARGLGVHLCSNGYWAKNTVRADAKMEELVSHGLEHLMLSTDIFHLPYVDLETVINAAHAAERAGVSCQIAVPSLRGDLTSIQLLGRLQTETNAHVFTHPIHPIGRGASLPVRQLPRFSRRPEPCELVGHIEVDVDGTVAVCPTSADFDLASPLQLGHIGRESWSEIIDRYVHTPWFFLLGTRGPVGLWTLLNRAGVRTGTALADHDHACHLCGHLNEGPQMVDAFEEVTGIDLRSRVSTEVLHDLLTQIDTAPPTPAATEPRARGREQPVRLLPRARLDRSVLVNPSIRGQM